MYPRGLLRHPNQKCDRKLNRQGVAVYPPGMELPAPAVTVVMPVHNALPYLDAAILSILDQTLTEFRFEIFDDHSDDGSYERALEWAERDRRIAVTRSAKRLGPCGSSDAAARLARGEFAARMDADDIAAPERLALQLEVMRTNPNAVLVGSVFDMIDGTGATIRAATPGQANGNSPPIAHASIFYRCAAFEAAGGYRGDTDYFEDQDLYRRMATQGDIAVINQPLIGLRFAGQHARLKDDRLEVIERLNRHYSKSFTGPTPASGRNIAPLALYSVAVLAALGLERPALLGLAARRIRLDRPLQAFAIMGFLALAEVSPRLGRICNQLFTRLRQAGSANARERVWIWNHGRA